MAKRLRVRDFREGGEFADMEDLTPLIVASTYRGRRYVESVTVFKAFFYEGAKYIFSTYEQAEKDRERFFPKSQRRIKEVICLQTRPKKKSH